MPLGFFNKCIGGPDFVENALVKSSADHHGLLYFLTRSQWIKETVLKT